LRPVELFYVELEALPDAGSRLRAALREWLESSPDLADLSFQAQSATSEVVMLLLETTTARTITVRGARLWQALEIVVTGRVEGVRGSNVDHQLAFRLLCATTTDVRVDVGRASEGTLEVTLVFDLA
jgi:hypothetical protein